MSLSSKERSLSTLGKLAKEKVVTKMCINSLTILSPSNNVFLHGCHHELTVEKQKKNEKVKKKRRVIILFLSINHF